MAKISLQALGRKLIERRGEKGIREVAAEIGVSPATLSRIERGYLPDIETFGKVCRWLNVDPGTILGIPSSASATSNTPRIGVHFKKDQALAPRTAQALAQMILAAQRALMATRENE